MTSNGDGKHPLRLLIRADGGRSIGSGHVVRSLALARVFKQRGIHAVFAIRGDGGSLVDRIRAEGHEVMTLVGDVPSGAVADGPWPAEAQQRDLEQIISRSAAGYAAVIVDHYGLDAHWERGVRRLTGRVLAVDDLANRPHDADVLVDHNWYGPGTVSRYDDLVPRDRIRLLGPRYALLQADYARARETMSPAVSPPRRILVSFGGSDPTGETLKVVDALSSPEFRGVAVDVVLGDRDLITGRLQDIVGGRSNTSLHVALPTLAELLRTADLAIGASGAATWERMCLGVPALVTTTSEAHSGVTRAFANAGMTMWAGLGGEVTTARYRQLLLRVMHGSVARVPPIVDGYGAARVAEALLPADVSELAIREATELDAPMFLGVDPGGAPEERRQIDGPAVWEREGNRYRTDIQRAHQALLVVMLGPVPIGRARARLIEGSVAASFTLDDFVTGRGLGPLVAALLRNSAWSVAGSQLTHLRVDEDAPDGEEREETESVGPLFGSIMVPPGRIQTES